MAEQYDYIEKEKHGDGDKRFSVNINNIKTIEDIKEVLKLSRLNTSFADESIINKANEHLIRVDEEDWINY